MDNKILIAFAVAVGLTIATNFLKNHFMNRYTLKIMKAMAEDEQTFNNLIDSNPVKLLFEPFNREYMRMNYYIAHDNFNKIQEQAVLMEKNMRTAKKQKLAILQMLFQYYLSKENKTKTREYQKKLNEFFDENGYEEEVKEEINISVAIFIDKDTSLLPMLDEKINEGGQQAIAWLMRRAFLHNELKEEEKAADDLKKAYELCEDNNQKEVIEALLKAGFSTKE